MMSKIVSWRGRAAGLLGSRRGLVAAALLSGCVVAVGAGCDAVGEEPHPEPSQALAAFEQTPPDVVVARVNGRAIGLDAFEVFWGEHPELGAREALDRLVERELLVQAAADAGLADADAVVFARKQGLVQALLDRMVEREITVESLPHDELARYEAQVANTLRRPAGVRASHLLVHVPKERPGPGGKNQAIPEAERAALYEQARAWADRLAGELGEQTSIDALYEAQARFGAEVPAPLVLLVNAHLTFPVPTAGEPQQAGPLPHGWITVVDEFARAAAELASRPAGTRSQAVKSDFGWHLIVFERAFERVEPDPQLVAARAREELVRRKRGERVAELSGEWIESSTIQLFPQVLVQQSQTHRE